MEKKNYDVESNIFFVFQKKYPEYNPHSPSSDIDKDGDDDEM